MIKGSIKEFVASAKGAKWNDRELANKAVELAELILDESNSNMKRDEKRQSKQLARMMDDAPGKALTMSLADKVFRPATVERSAEMFRYLLDGYGVPHYLDKVERLAMGAGAKMSEYAPGIVMPLVTRQLRQESAKVILPSEDNKLRPHLRKRKKSGILMNINQLGEAILGEYEAENRLKQILDRLADPDCNYISVKISAIYSQIHLVAFEETVKEIQNRLRILYRAAIKNPYVDENGVSRPKFINLDMEEYRDLHLTAEAFKRTLMEPEFINLEGGIVLQAYLPDSWEEQMKLCKWAKERVEQGGARIKIRLVKGANLAMEKIDAALHDWPLAPYESKEMVDANYKRMLHYGCKPENAKFVQFGVASHNLFDLCYTLLLREREGVKDQVELEMLEGMANHQARIIAEAADGLLLYAPVVRKEDFHSAIAYLVRRLDENTSEENFLHDLFGMTPGSKEWEIQKRRFLKACQDMETTKYGPNRKQDRSKDEVAESSYGDDFYNEADTDWSLRANSQWINDLISKESEIVDFQIPLVINGEEKTTNLWGVGRDPSLSGKKVYQFAYADYDEVEDALKTAENAEKSWAKTTIAERGKLLHKAAKELGLIRGKAIAAMVRDAGKVPSEGDVEISEGIDFCRYYAEGLDRAGMKDGVSVSPLGTICVAPPWNFPFAIPVGGIAAALMTGNTVIFKPAAPTVYTAYLIAQAFWKAGVPKEVLQFVPAPPNQIGQKLLVDPRIDAVILTGSYDTAKLFKSWRPDLPLFAETSGKDAMIITATADPDQAIKDLVKSAFGHSGQKCSAASIAIIEAPVYDNPHFMKQLKDAASSLKVGGSWDINSIVTPVIREPKDNLLRGLTQLDEGEAWLLKPEQIGENPYLWSPGIRIGVKQGSWYHQNECFGPVLGLIRAENLQDAINIQNDSNFGLTGGLQSLDDREIAIWKEKVQIGNAYINRAITGAIVRRQPFGGWKRSSVGPGSKAGGPNYLTLFVHAQETALPQELMTPNEKVKTLLELLTDKLPDCSKRIRAAAGSQSKWWNEEFSKEHDPSQIYGENNIFRYVPIAKETVRVNDMSDGDLAVMIIAAKLAGTHLTLSMAKGRPWLNAMEAQGWDLIMETEEELIKRINAGGKDIEYLRIIDKPSLELASALNANDIVLLTRPVLANGRWELLNYFREQAISETIHRYGNIVAKPEELLHNKA